ncbi:MAG: 4-hydroxythreonine-4-phosphate dehydrogenase PdxA [Candidatus Lightella neohaematopini]|nr:4-hydroxythreonine-4-phosphate dehydrogenase PdxA [Candidatus Lightella neohaematopini]
MILHNYLKHDCKIFSSCIYICGLNSHAGKSRFLGTKEINIMT